MSMLPLHPVPMEGRRSMGSPGTGVKDSVNHHMGVANYVFYKSKKGF